MRQSPGDFDDLRRALEGGSVQNAYRALLGYMNDLRRHFRRKYPKYTISALYQGYLDMTYFAVMPPSLKRRGLKIAVVFNYEHFRFEAWLSARNEQIHRKLWPLFNESQWPSYRVVPPGTGVDSIVEYDLTERPDFADLQNLTSAIDNKVREFVDDMEVHLSRRATQT
jgi:hypothetical protein